MIMQLLTALQDIPSADHVSRHLYLEGMCPPSKSQLFDPRDLHYPEQFVFGPLEASSQHGYGKQSMLPLTIVHISHLQN